MYISRIRIRPDVRDLHLLIDANSYGAHQLLWKLFPSESEGRRFLFREEIAREQIPFHKGVKGEPVFYTVSETLPASDHPLFAVESKQYTPRLNEGDRLAFRLRANPTIARKTVGKKNSIRHDVVMDVQYHLLRELAAEMAIPASCDKSEIKKRIHSAWRQMPNTEVIESRLRGVVAENERYKKVDTGRPDTAQLLDMALKARMNKALEKWLSDKGKTSGFSLVCDSETRHLKFQAEGYQWHALPKKGKTAGFSSVDFEGEIEVTDAVLFSETLFKGIGPSKGFGCGLMLVRRV